MGLSLITHWNYTMLCYPVEHSVPWCEENLHNTHVNYKTENKISVLHQTFYTPSTNQAMRSKVYCTFYHRNDVAWWHITIVCCHPIYCNETDFSYTKLQDWLYTFHISHFVDISRMFLQNTPQNTKHSLYTFPISCEFRVLLMPQKNKPQILWFFARMPTLAWNAVKCKKRKKGAKREKSDAKYTAVPFSFFTFCDHLRVFRDMCIAGLKSSSIV